MRTEVPHCTLYEKRLEEEPGDHVDFELVLIPVLIMSFSSSSSPTAPTSLTFLRSYEYVQSPSIEYYLSVSILNDLGEACRSGRHPIPTALRSLTRLPMSSFLSHRGAQNPPSASMKNGTYRIRRGPLSRDTGGVAFPSSKYRSCLEDISAPEQTARNESQTRSASLISQEKRLVLLVMSLVFATFCCFGTAYYLFTVPRCVSVSSRMGVALGLVADQPFVSHTFLQAVACNLTIWSPPDVSTES